MTIETQLGRVEARRAATDFSPRAHRSSVPARAARRCYDAPVVETRPDEMMLNMRSLVESAVEMARRVPGEMTIVNQLPRPTVMPAPVVNVEATHVNVSPTPIEVRNEINVAPSPLEMRNEVAVSPTPIQVDVQPPSVSVTNITPLRRITKSVIRDERNQIIRIVEEETD